MRTNSRKASSFRAGVWAPNVMKASERKGSALEGAVALIQSAILKADPRLAGDKFTIETNKIVTVNGVHHEIDVYVTTNSGSNYEATYLFECKDWKKPVGKNEVIILTAKVQATGAARGFLVARSFTKDAMAQIAMDPRLRELTCQDASLGALRPELLHIVHEPNGLRVNIKERGVPLLPNPSTLDWRTVQCRFEGRPTAFVPFVSRYVESAAEQDKRQNQAMYRQTSAHHRRQTFKVDFEPGELLIDGWDIDYMVLMFEFWVEVTSKRLCSKLELDGQGRAFSFEPVELAAGKTVKVDVVQRI